MIKKLKSKESKKKVASEFGISIGEVSAISKKDKEIITTFKANEPFSKHRIFAKKMRNKNMNNHVWKIFCQMGMKNLPVTGLLVRIFMKMRKHNIKASCGWLNHFKSQHNIEFKINNSGVANVIIDAVGNGKENIRM